MVNQNDKSDYPNALPPVKPGLGVQDIRHIPPAHRELRFTRNRTGKFLLLCCFTLLAAALFLLLTGYDTFIPYIPLPLWGLELCVLIPAVICFFAARRCLKYAAIIITPLGVELLPFLRPRHTMHWIMWQQIQAVTLDQHHLILQLTDNQTEAISLRALSLASRQLLYRAVRERIDSLHSLHHGQA